MHISARSDLITVTGQTWLYIGVTAVAGIALGGFILTRTQWFKIRKYAIDMKKVYDNHKDLQSKVEAAQQVAQNPHVNAVLRNRALNDVIDEQKKLIADIEKVKAPEKATELHSDTLALQRETLDFYVKGRAGGFGQKALNEKQKKLMTMSSALEAKMEKVYGPMKKPADKKK